MKNNQDISRLSNATKSLSYAPNQNPADIGRNSLQVFVKQKPPDDYTPGGRPTGTMILMFLETRCQFSRFICAKGVIDIRCFKNFGCEVLGMVSGQRILVPDSG
jgi:hypothetical protein